MSNWNNNSNNNDDVFYNYSQYNDFERINNMFNFNSHFNMYNNSLRNVLDQFILKTEPIISPMSFTPIELSIRTNNKSEFSKLINNENFDINAKYENHLLGEFTLLHLLCQYENSELLEYYINHLTNNNHRIDINAQDRVLDTPLHYACRRNSIDCIEILIKNNANINAKNRFNYTPLHIACKKGHDKYAKILLNNDADMNIVNDIGNTPLHIACQNKFEQCVEALLENNANIDAQNNNGETPIYLIVMSQNQDLIDMLLKKDSAILNKCNDNYDTMLHILAANQQINAETISFLIKKNISINQLNRNNEVALSIAVDKANIEFINGIITMDETKVIINDDIELSPLKKSIESLIMNPHDKPPQEIVLTLITRETIEDLKSEYGENYEFTQDDLMSLAIKYNHHDAIKILMSYNE